MVALYVTFMENKEKLGLPHQNSMAGSMLYSIKLKKNNYLM